MSTLISYGANPLKRNWAAILKEPWGPALLLELRPDQPRLNKMVEDQFPHFFAENPQQITLPQFVHLVKQLKEREQLRALVNDLGLPWQFIGCKGVYDGETDEPLSFQQTLDEGGKKVVHFWRSKKLVGDTVVFRGTECVVAWNALTKDRSGRARWLHCMVVVPTHCFVPR